MPKRGGSRPAPVCADVAEPSAATAAHRLSELLMSFPSAATNGVQWRVLAKTYADRYGAPLSLASLGHSSPLAAVSALLWEVLRVVDREDTDNPVLGIEDGVALTLQTGQLACWPSLYQSLCNIVLEHGVLEAGADDDSARCLLLSNLRPLWESEWHSKFDETTLGYRNEDGSFVKFKKMKHLLNSVVRWRDDFVASRRSYGGKRSAIDEALAPALDLVPSTNHNDLVLRCSMTSLTTPVARPNVKTSRKQSNSLMSELKRLRAENEELREKNESLQVGCPVDEQSMPLSLPAPQLPADIFDDPYEPPPAFWQDTSSCALSSRLGFDDEDVGSIRSESQVWSQACSSTTSWHSRCASTAASGATSPMRQMAPPQACTFVPVWVPFNNVAQSASACFADVAVIPNGIVHAARQQFERVGSQLLK